MSEPEKNPVTVLRGIREEIFQLEGLIKFLSIEGRQLENDHRSIARLYGGAAELRKKFLDDTQRGIDALRAKERWHIASNPQPELVCPNCGYDGEFDADVPKGKGFRILMPILQPRMILQYRDGTMEISDLDETYDAFDGIASPEYDKHLDDPDGDPVQAKYRKMLRGKWLILCDECDRYFEGEDIVAKSHIDYCGNAPWDSKWRKAEEARTKKRFEEEDKQSRLDA